MRAFDSHLAADLAELPLAGLRREYPNKLDHVLYGPEDLRSPRELHPAFYGCFDWHSSVHGHWMLVRLLRRFDLPNQEAIREALAANLTEANLAAEAAYLRDPQRKGFERMYGWAWLLKLAQELSEWDDEQGRKWAQWLAPAAEAIGERYLEFLPRQTYPIRVGTHTNTAFGLTFALDYARACNAQELECQIVIRARDYFVEDTHAPLHLEPGGADFLSPTLIEADLMRRVLEPDELEAWLRRFLPALDAGLDLVPAVVSDRTDGQICHLDGLNLSRAWCLYALARALPRHADPLRALADRHAEAGMEGVASGHYEGEHWLASFALLMLEQREA